MAEIKELTDLGNYLKHKRNVQKLSMDDVANRTNISKAYLSQIEHNRRLPSANKIDLLVDIYHIEPEEEIAIHKYCRNLKGIRKQEVRNARPDKEDKIYVLEGEGLTEEDIEDLKEIIKKKKAARKRQ